MLLVLRIMFVIIRNFFTLKVLKEKELEIRKAKKNQEEQMKEVIEESRKSFQLTKQQSIVEEITKIEYDYKQKLEEKEKLYNDLYVKFNKTSDSWKLEKRVILFRFTIMITIEM